MKPEAIAPLLPGIRAIFSAVGRRALASITTEGKIDVTLLGEDGQADEVRTFPFPRTNRELSEQLLRWRAEL